MKAVWNNEILAESSETILLEGNHYFPPNALNQNFVVSTDTHTTCPLKGVASYYTLKVQDSENVDAVWYYPNPKEGYEHIQNYVAFWKGVEVIES